MSNPTTGEIGDPAAVAFTAWQAGDLTAMEALQLLVPELDGAQAMRVTLEEREKELRAYVEAVLRRLSPTEPLPLGGLVLELTRASITKGYDRKALDALAQELPAEWRERLDGCRTETTRAGGLRVTRPREL
ncbi:MAG: hypothetical protein IT190_08430 [Microbacteriaceae bacterium]|nr:hypothetical protein [Microbacteriaceae bacterium]